MASILNFFRSSVRHPVHLRAVAGTVRTRGIATPPHLSEKEGTESLEEIASMIDEAADEGVYHFGSYNSILHLTFCITSYRACRTTRNLQTVLPV